MKTIRSLASIALAGVLTHIGSASVTINVSAETLRDSAGSAISQDSLVLLVASSSDSNFTTAVAGANSLGVGSVIGGTDDVVLWRGNLQNGDVGALLESANVNFTAINNPVALYWFPTLTTSSLSLSSGVSYGLFTDTIGRDGGDSWLMPADGSVVNFNFITKDASVLGSNGFYDNSVSWATLTSTAVPEPSTYAAVLGAMVLGVVGYRRFRRS